MATQIEKWMPLILFGGALWFLSRGGLLSPVNGNGNGNGGVSGGGGNGNGGVSGGGGTSGEWGRATVGGEIISTNLAEANRIPPAWHRGRQNMGLGSHRAEKSPGDLVTVDVGWSQNTVDVTGAPIPWPSKLRVELGHSTGWWGVAGWETMNSLLGGSSGVATIESSGDGTASGFRTDQLQMAVATVQDPGTLWDVKCHLLMQDSDDSGSPNGNWSVVDEMSHTEAITTIASVGYSDVIGGLDDIDVYQGQGQMRRLSMGQARPPGGIRTGEVRHWPTSNRNTTLPGVQIRVRQDGYLTGYGPGRQVVAV